MNLRALDKLELGKLWNFTQAVNATEDFMSEWSEAWGDDQYTLCPFRETGLKNIVYRWIYWLAMTRVPLTGYGEAFPFFAERFPFGTEHQIDGRQRWITAYMSDKNVMWCRNYLNELRKGEEGI